MDEKLILVMGATASGKSSYINSIVGEEVATVGHGLESPSSCVQGYPWTSTSGLSVLLVDTPGFDDLDGTTGVGMAAVDVLRMITAWMRTKYSEDKKLSGIIYVHDITRPCPSRMRRRDMAAFKSLRGTGAMVNVTVVTTFWDRLASFDDGFALERALQGIDADSDDEEGLLKELYESGATFARSGHWADEVEDELDPVEFPFAPDVVERLLPPEPVFAQTQEEAGKDVTVLGTSTGQTLQDELDELRRECRQSIAHLDANLSSALQTQLEARIFNINSCTTLTVNVSLIRREMALLRRLAVPGTQDSTAVEDGEQEDFGELLRSSLRSEIRQNYTEADRPLLLEAVQLAGRETVVEGALQQQIETLRRECEAGIYDLEKWWSQWPADVQPSRFKDIESSLAANVGLLREELALMRRVLADAQRDNPISGMEDDVQQNHADLAELRDQHKRLQDEFKASHKRLEKMGQLAIRTKRQYEQSRARIKELENQLAGSAQQSMYVTSVAAGGMSSVRSHNEAGGADGALQADMAEKLERTLVEQLRGSLPASGYHKAPDPRSAPDNLQRPFPHAMAEHVDFEGAAHFRGPPPQSGFMRKGELDRRNFQQQVHGPQAVPPGSQARGGSMGEYSIAVIGPPQAIVATKSHSNESLLRASNASSEGGRSGAVVSSQSLPLLVSSAKEGKKKKKKKRSFLSRLFGTQGS